MTQYRTVFGRRARVAVARRRELALEAAAQACLLLDLAYCRVLLALAGLELPFRERPVVVRGAMDDEDLLDAVLAATPDEAASGANRSRHIQARSSGSESCVPCGTPEPSLFERGRSLQRGQRCSRLAPPLASSARAAQSSSQRAATTASFRSPSTSWRQEAACAKARAGLPTIGAAASAA